MLSSVADTHALIWYLYDDPRLSATARAFMERAVVEGDQIGVWPISLIEVVFLTERGRIQPQTFARLLTALDTSNSVLVEVPCDRQVAAALTRINRQDIPELPDRILAATALFLGVPLISRDRRILAASIPTIW